MDLDVLFVPFERADEALTHAFEGAPLAGTLLLAVLLGLRHAADPDHLVAVTSLVSAREGGMRAAAALGGWWGAGHAATMLLAGLPLILLHTRLPAGLETLAERLIGVVIVVLALRVLWRWVRGGYRARTHRHPPAPPHRHLAQGAHVHAHHHHHDGHDRGRAGHAHATRRGPVQAAGLGLLHGLAGTGAVVVLLLASAPTPGAGAVALAVFAPMSVLSMAACTGLYAWVLTRPRVEPVYRLVLMPALGLLALVFGAWYAGG